MAGKNIIKHLPAQTDGTTIGELATDKAGFHGEAVVQRAGAAQAAVSTASLTVGGSYSQSEVQALATRCAALTTLVNELRAALVEKGVIKGAA